MTSFIFIVGVALGSFIVEFVLVATYLLDQPISYLKQEYVGWRKFIIAVLAAFVFTVFSPFIFLWIVIRFIVKNILPGLHF